MTLGNLRELGVRSLAVTCGLCHREAVLLVDGWGDDMFVRDFRPRMVCTRCGIIGADARPNWREMRQAGIGGARRLNQTSIFECDGFTFCARFRFRAGADLSAGTGDVSRIRYFDVLTSAAIDGQRA